jgi:tRNA ligase
VTSKHSLGTTILPKDKLEAGNEGPESGNASQEVSEQQKVAKETSTTSAKAETHPNEVAPVFDLSTKSGQKKAAKYAAQQAKKAEKANADRDRDTYQQEAKAEADAKKQGAGQADSDVPAHAEMGRRWLRKTLQKGGKTEQELAKTLWDRNLTAVTEVSAFRFPTGIHVG